MCGCRMHDVKQAADAVEDGEVATEERSLAEEPASRALSLFNAIRMTSDPGINPHRAAHLKFSVLLFIFFKFVSKNKTKQTAVSVACKNTELLQPKSQSTQTHTGEKLNSALVM